jgi:hypothetical protein
MTRKNALRAALAALALSFFSAIVEAARPLGVVRNIPKETSCPTSLGGAALTWLPTDACYHAIVSCARKEEV